MKADVLWCLWEKELEGKLANSTSESGVIKNCIGYYHNKLCSVKVLATKAWVSMT